jgi:hypothetical protein
MYDFAFRLKNRLIFKIVSIDKMFKLNVVSEVK